MWGGHKALPTTTTRENKMGTLREEVEGQGVAYVLERCTVLLLEKGQDISKPKGDGTYIQERTPDIYVTRAHKGTNLTYKFNPLDEKQAEVISVYDEWIAKNPGKARAKGFYKVGDVRPQNFIQRWDEMTVEQIEAVVDAMQPNLVTAMQYELLRPEDLGGPREEVIDLLETIYAEGSSSEIEASEEAPVI